MQTDIIDYRNGQYQGPTNSFKQRHGLGIFIDDDLAFHISHWCNNKLNGPTLLYFTHGKYIYGQWKLNEPHGLNIYRSGDTVLLSKYKQGLPSERCLLIFQKYNFACVMCQTDQQWKILQSGPLPNHKVLLKYIEQIGLPVADHHFSLTKYACAFSNNNSKIKTFPCLSNYCYFGFLNGLGIIFNSNNGVVSVGHHRNQEICEFGGKFQGAKMAAQGNFDDGQVVQYLGVRPTNKIHSIFQKLHKKGINFYNEYFDSKAKIFNLIDNMIRNKLQDIAQEGRKTQQFKHLNLNDSLEYKEYDEGESIKLTQNRQKMYSPPKKTFERNICKMNQSHRKTESNKRYTNDIHRSKNKETMKNIPERGYYIRQFQDKINEDNMQISIKGKKLDQNEHCQYLNTNKQRQKSYLKDKSRSDQQQYSNKNGITNYFIPQNAHQKDINSKQFSRYTPNKKEEAATFSKMGISLYNKNGYSKMYHQQSQIENDESSKAKNNKIPTFRGLLEGKRQQEEEKSDNEVQNLEETSTFQKNHLKQLISKMSNQPINIQDKIHNRNTPISKKRSQSSIKRPTYQDIQQRRKRIIKQFKQLNEEPSTKMISPKIDSPAKFQQIIISSKQSRESHFGCMPLSISNRNVQKNKTPQKKLFQNIQQIESATKTFHKTPLNERKENNVLPQQTWNESKNTIMEQEKQNKNSFIFQRVNSEMILSQLPDSKPPKKDELFSRNNDQISQSSLTPTRQKRTYQYLFE